MKVFRWPASTKNEVLSSDVCLLTPIHQALRKELSRRNQELLQQSNVFDVQIKAPYIRLEGARMEAGPWNIFLMPLLNGI